MLHMLLFWTLILFDSYAYSYKNRGCRMCNSPLTKLLRKNSQSSLRDASAPERESFLHLSGRLYKPPSGELAKPQGFD